LSRVESGTDQLFEQRRGCRRTDRSTGHTLNEELTARQRQVFVAIVLNGVPLDALTVELASNRNAIYKTLFDARRKLRAALADNGYIGDDASRGS